MVRAHGGTITALDPWQLSVTASWMLPPLKNRGIMEKTRKDALIYIADLSVQLADLARLHEFEVIAALLATAAARANSLLTQDPDMPDGPLN